MAENNTSNTPSATPSEAGAKLKFIFPAVSCLLVIVVFLALFYGSVILYRKAAKKNIREAQFTLGMHHKYGLGVAKDKFEAWDLWRKAAEQDLEPAKKKMADIRGEIQSAANAENADPRAMIAWSSCLENGWGVEQDACEAWIWLAYAASKKSEPALKKIESLREEIGSAANAENAASLAQLVWGLCLNNGWGVEQNKDEASAWLDKAGANDPETQFKLGQCFSKGFGVEQDEKAAFKWFLKAAEQDLIVAQREVANRYQTGKGVEKNEKTAAEWMKKADELEKKEAERKKKEAEEASK